MKILGHEYKLISTPSDQLGSYGRYLAKEQILQVASDLHRQQITTTVLHEIIEALDYHLGLNLNHDAIMSLEAGLYQTLTDNGVDLSPLIAELPDG